MSIGSEPQINQKLLLLPGDGIGPEIMNATKDVIGWFSRIRGLNLDIQEDLIGGAAYDEHGVPLADETLEAANAADAILLGAVGGPAYDEIEFSLKPERGLLRLRKELDLFSNLRPAKCFDALVQSSSLKPELVTGLDLMIVRELTSGLYFGEPRGISGHGDDREGVNTQRYTTDEVRRVARSAFEISQKRRNRVVSVEKSNVMESGILWREEVQWVRDNEYPDVELSHMYADNCCMQLVRDPKQFDVILTDNLFGDLLSDCAAMLTGSLGMLPSASLGSSVTGKVRALYEPVHGSAPDIAGKSIANPLACILSFAMALRHSLNRPADANLLELAVESTLESGTRTVDISDQGPPCSTEEMVASLIDSLKAHVSTS